MFKRVIVTLAAVILASGCSEPKPIPPFVPTPPIELLANLELSNLSVNVAEQNTWRIYEPRFRIRETSGRSAARIQVISLAVPAAGMDVDDSEMACWALPLRIESGQSSEVFGERYCAQYIAVRGIVPYVDVTVQFTDDADTWGSVTARIDVPVDPS